MNTQSKLPVILHCDVIGVASSAIEALSILINTNGLEARFYDADMSPRWVIEEKGV